MKKLFLLLFAAIASLTVFSQQPKSEPHPVIFVESNTIDYGIVKKGSDGLRKIKVYNKGTVAQYLNVPKNQFFLVNLQ